MIKKLFKNNLNICIIGSTMLTDSVINSLIKRKLKPKLILTNFRDSYNNDWVDFKKKYSSINCYSIKPNNEKKIVYFLKKKKINLLFCVGWSHILSKKILNIPKLLVVGHHPTALPNNRGKHPLVWSIFLGLKATASTFFLMDEGIDTGKIINQRKILIKKNSPVINLYKKVQKVLSTQVFEVIDYIINKNYILTSRYVNKKTTRTRIINNYWRKRDENDGKIDFKMTSGAILQLVNSLSKPYVGAHIEFGGKKCKVWKVSIDKKIKKKKY